MPTPPAGRIVETGLMLWLREIIETKGLAGVGLPRLVMRIFFFRGVVIPCHERRQSRELSR
jgi:hypothetical protein